MFAFLSSQTSILARVKPVISIHNVRRPLQQLPIAFVNLVLEINLNLCVTNMELHMLVNVNTSWRFAKRRQIFQYYTKGDANVSLVINRPDA